MSTVSYERYLFDGNLTSVMKDRPFSIQGAKVIYGTGKNGQCLSLTDYYQLDLTNVSSFLNKDFTITFWFKAPSTGLSKYPNFRRLVWAKAASYRGIEINSNGRIAIVLDGNTVSSSRQYNDNVWHFVAWKHAGTAHSIILDGTEVITNSCDNTFGDVLYLSHASYSLNGMLDNLYLFETVLSDQDIDSVLDGTYNEPVVDIVIDAPEILEVGDSIGLSTSLLPTDSQGDVAYSSDNDAVISIDGNILTANSIGAATITAQAGNIRKSRSIAVKQLIGIKVSNLPDKNVYFLGEEFNSSGIIISGIFEDFSEIILGEGRYALTGFNSSAAGRKTITVTYKDFSTSFFVSVILDALAQYLNTTEGMNVIVNNTKHDDDSVSVNGVDWFRFNNVIASKIYANGNHWIGFGVSSEQLKICRRDGAMYSLYRQEGLLYGYYKFLKIRWEGYTQYNSTDVSRRLVYELFLFDTGDMFLNVIQAPTNSSYIGTSQMVCGSNTYNLNIPIASTPMITFTHQDDTGSSWVISYEKINILPPFDRRYLIRDGAGQYYTITDGALIPAQIDSLSAQAFREHGVEPDAFQPALMKALINPTVLYWQDSNLTLPEKKLGVQATPPPQVVYSGRCDMTHESIKGIASAYCNTSDDALFQLSFDDWKTWLIYNADAAAWESVTGDEAGMTKGVVENIPQEAWAEQATTGMYEWKILLPGTTSYLDMVKVNYIN
ncbi:bacterial Ig-like domain-containing protein [Anaerovorax odorimutans]|uniref:Bacterial Ig-like domain-containing protein n=1 Tax=Anaerovorax odorimutans TaxID=109327 RepID=A0ABT1RP95_9FIRM|nr:LamG-like jellyroll fold domain-containing protein [Anaerovorax odorimutans]MCQ4637015.1 bacterial Ig-like domain-containing protein [Anaerovorax odorimutans]